MSKSVTSKSENSAAPAAVCRVCGRSDVALYQKNTCKACLAKEFRELIPAINNVRSYGAAPRHR